MSAGMESRVALRGILRVLPFLGRRARSSIYTRKRIIPARTMLDEKLFIYVQVEIIVFNDILVFRE